MVNQLYKLLICVIFPIIITGCSNAVSYHHSERNSIALEFRTTEPQQPLQGNIGIKTRTVLVTPGLKDINKDEDKDKDNDKDIKNTETDSNESLSVISDFNFKRSPVDGLHFGITTIKSAFITGEAANKVAPDTIKALSGTGYGAIDDLTSQRESILSNIYDQLGKMKNDKVALQHLENLNKLRNWIPDISKNIYYHIVAKTNLEKVTGIKPGKNFDGVIEYHRLLKESLVSLDDKNINKFNNKAINIDVLLIIQSEKKRLEKERKEFFDRIGNSHEIDLAAAYVISFI